MYKRLSQCRACGGTDLVEVFQFAKPMPLANDFVLPGGEHQGFVPLRILFCRNCTLAQLGETVHPNILYKNYLYVTSNSQTMQRHFDRLVKDIISESGTGSMIEAGSNDGLFLKFAKSRGFGPVMGIDPAENLGEHLADNERVFGIFNSQNAANGKKLIMQCEEVNAIVARHCFCHSEWNDFMMAATSVASKNTLVCIEVPYAPDLLRRVEFDSIYQEHTSYLTLKSVVHLLKNYPFHLHGVLRYGIHGGCVLLMLRHNDSGITPHLSADEMLLEEHVTVDTWKDFAIRTRMKIENLQKLVEDLKGSKGGVISMFGASAKGSVLINACGFDREQIAFVTDNSPLKPGRLVPGTDIPVIPEEEMLSQHPNYAICAAWNYRSEILGKMTKYRERGGKFIFPTESGWEVV